MIEIRRLSVEHMRQIVLFDKTCFPIDFWKEEDWKELLEDQRAIYYALLDGTAPCFAVRRAAGENRRCGGSAGQVTRPAGRKNAKAGKPFPFFCV